LLTSASVPRRGARLGNNKSMFGLELGGLAIAQN
jgi:hypothetical protein